MFRGGYPREVGIPGRVGITGGMSGVGIPDGVRMPWGWVSHGGVVGTHPPDIEPGIRPVLIRSGGHQNRMVGKHY